MSTDLSIQQPGNLAEKPQSGKVLQLDAQTQDIDLSSSLAKVLGCFDTATAVNGIEHGVQYVVQVPAKFQQGLADGTFSIMENAKTGKQWATLVRKLANGKNEIVCNMPIKPESVVQGNPMHDISANMQLMALQQQIASLTELVQKVYDAVQHIEQGQTDDRIGLLLAGKEGVEQAMHIQNETLRLMKLAEAQQTLLNARGQIAATLRTKVNSFPSIPKSPLNRFGMELANSGSLAKCDDAFESIQLYYQSYLVATQLLAESHLYCGEWSTAEKVYAQGIDFLSGLDFRNVKSLQYIHPEDDFTDTICEQAVPYMQSAKTISLESARPYDYIELEVTGEQILAAIGGVEHENV